MVLNPARRFAFDPALKRPGPDFQRILLQMLLLASASGCQPSERNTASGPHLQIPVLPALTPDREVRPEETAEQSSRGPAREPPPATLPESWAPQFKRQARCDQPLCTLTHWLPDASYALTPYEELPAPAALWVHELAQHSQLRILPHPGLQLLVLPFSGELGFRDLAANPVASEPTKLPRWSALRAPGAAIELSCSAPRCLVVLGLVAPEGTLAEVLARQTTARQVPPERTLEVRAFSSVPVLAWNGNKNRARVLFGAESASQTSQSPNQADAGRAPPAATTPLTSPSPFSLTLLEADPDVSIPVHRHESEWENLLLLQSQGALELRGRSYAITGGEAIHVPPGVSHGFSASGKGPLVAIQLYTPPGPERRFLLLAGAEAKAVTGTGTATGSKVPP